MDVRILAVLAVWLAAVFTDRRCAAEPNPDSHAAVDRPSADAAGPEGASASPDRNAQLILLTVAADTNESRNIEAVAAELLGRLSLKLDFRQVENIDLEEVASPRRSSARYLACAYIDLRTPGSATLYLVDPVHDRILVRRVEREAGGEEVAHEELGHILETSAEGLLTGLRIGMPRREVAPSLVAAPKPAAKKPPPVVAIPSPTNSNFAHLSVLYEGEVMSGSAPLSHGPVLGLLGHHSLDRVAVGLWLLAQYRWSYDLASQPVGARVGGGAARLLATLDVLENATVSWRFAVGAGADVVKLRPTSSGTEDVTLASSRWLTFAMLRAELVGRLRLGSMHLLAAAFADVDPSNTTYVFGSRSGLQAVLRPWMVRPGLALGLELP